jgi:hypothetical protein
MKVLKQAFVVLSDPARRVNYGRQLATRRARARQGIVDSTLSGGMTQAISDIIFHPKVIVLLIGLAAIAIVLRNVVDHERAETERYRTEKALDIERESQGMNFTLKNRREDRLDKNLEYQKEATFRHQDMQSKAIEYNQRNASRHQDMQESALYTVQSEIAAERKYLNSERDRLAKIREEQEAKQRLRDRVDNYERSYRSARELRAAKMGITVEQLDRIENQYNK